ncbi:MAG: ATP-binding cassette domain-containing protein [Firmicutes bacterium]|nr:ATP-binding cassette domain-containing protein [Bacillota bacterium]
MAEAIVTVEGLRVRYALADEPALEGVRLEVEPGEFCGVTGPHGAGKSTLAYALMGLLPHVMRADVEGRVRVAGRDPIAEGAARLAGDVALCLQNPYNQISGARDTVYDEIAFGLENLGLPPDEIRARVDEALARFGLEAVAEENPFACSGGQVQRLAIASAWVMRPRVLILDEPTSQLDPHGAREVEAAVEAARRQGMAVIVIEHRAEWLAARADRLLVLRAGRPVAAGPARRLYGAAELQEEDLPRPVYTRVARRVAELGAELGGGGTEPWPLTEDEAVGQLRPVVSRRAAGSAGDARSAGTAGAAGGADDAAAARPGRAATAGAAPAGSPSLLIDDVHFAYEPGRPVIRGISTEIRGPGVTALIGRNGGGKSTLLRLLLGLVRPDRGRVVVDGLDTARATVAQVARRLAMAFQNPDDQLFLGTVLDEAMYGAKNIGRPPEAARASAVAALEALGLAGMAGRHPYDLGFGLRKLVTVAAAVAMETPILVLDEPTMAQDEPSLRRLAALVRRLAESGRHVLLVTHHMEFAAQVAERVLVLSGGRILADGAPEDVFRREDVLAAAGVEAPAALRLARRLGLAASPVTPEGLCSAIMGS